MGEELTPDAIKPHWCVYEREREREGGKAGGRAGGRESHMEGARLNPRLDRGPGPHLLVGCAAGRPG